MEIFLTPLSPLAWGCLCLFVRRMPKANEPLGMAAPWEKHDQEKAATLAGLEDLSAQSCRRHCVDGFVRSADDLVSAVVWISNLAASPPRDRKSTRLNSSHSQISYAVFC